MLGILQQAKETKLVPSTTYSAKMGIHRARNTQVKDTIADKC